MIKIIKGIYGAIINGIVTARASQDGPFSVGEAEEKRLVVAGVAEYVSEKKNDKGKGASVKNASGKDGTEDAEKAPDLQTQDPVKE